MRFYYFSYFIMMVKIKKKRKKETRDCVYVYTVLLYILDGILIIPSFFFLHTAYTTFFAPQLTILMRN